MTETQTKLIEVQPTFKEDLLAGVEKFHVDTETFYEDYENKFVFSFDITQLN